MPETQFIPPKIAIEKFENMRGEGEGEGEARNRFLHLYVVFPLNKYRHFAFDDTHKVTIHNSLCDTDSLTLTPTPFLSLSFFLSVFEDC